MNGLALQGGGALGLSQSILLGVAEGMWNKPASAIFDIISGSSIGAIIGGALSIGIPAKEVELFFTKEAPVIFTGSWATELEAVWGPKYAAQPLEIALQAMLGDATLANCRVPFIATSYDWTSNRPVFFKSFEKSSQDANYITIGSDSDIKLWQICRASSAAQTYFPAYQYNNLILLDGGNISDNAPDMLLLAEMLNFTKSDLISMLSLGVGNTAWKPNNMMISPSLIRAGIETIKIVFSAGEDSQTYKAKTILKNQYYRLSPDLGEGIAMDDVAACLINIPPAVATLLSDPNTIAAINKFMR